MDVCRVCALLALALAIATARAHIASHDNILRIQLWDEEGLAKNHTSVPTPTAHNKYKSKVDLDTLYHAMLEESYGNEDFSRLTRHKVRHKRRRPRESATDPPWRFHAGEQSLNVGVYDEDVIDFGTEASLVHSVSSASFPDKEDRKVSPPMRLRTDEDTALEEEVRVKKQLPVVSKCCPSGQNLTATPVNGSRSCMRTGLTFQPVFFQANETHMWSYDSNVFEIIVDNPCIYDRYKLDPMVNSEDEFYLLVNGSLFAPFHQPPLLGTKDFCMETFWNESYPAGLTLPLVCFSNPVEEVKKSAMLTIYAIGLIISVPFLLATAAVYTFITDLRDTHGKSLACHSMCLAVAFSCLAATQLAGHAFHKSVCTIMAYLIQYSFVSCFFWLNVMCFDILFNVRRHLESAQSRRAMRRRFVWYCVYAIVLPLLILTITMVMDLSPLVPSSYLKPNFGVKGCWFKTDKAALPYFYIPVALILVSNLFIFFFTSRGFSQHYERLRDVNAYELTHSGYNAQDEWTQLELALGEHIVNTEDRVPPPKDKKQRLKRFKKLFRMSCLLSAIMGLSWVMEVVSWAAGAGSSVFSVWSIFDFINAMQGVVIFAIFVMQQPVRARVKSSRLCQMCRRRNNGSEMAVVSDRTSIEFGVGKRDDV